MILSRRSMLAGSAALFVAAQGSAKRTAGGGWYDKAIIIDGVGGFGDPYGADDVSRLSDRGWREIVETGVTIGNQTVLPVGNVADAWGEYKKNIQYFQEFFGANPDRVILVRSAADVLRAKRERKCGLILETQDSCMVGGALDRLAEMKKDGIRIVQLTYNNRNLSGDGSLEPGNAGVSKLGKATIERIEAEKLLLDLSHGGARTMAEGVAFAKRPMVISHTGARALYDHPRNTDDSTIRAVADKGGVVGVYFMPYLAGDMKPSGANLLDHVEHVARIAGEDHVAIGTDNGLLPLPMDDASLKQLRAWQEERAKAGIAAPGEGPDFIPIVRDYNSIDRYRRFAGDLAKRGWSQSRLEKLMGGNFLRVYREVWGG